MNDPRSTYARRVEQLATATDDLFAGNRIGLEKEGLRVSPTGQLATTPHPSALGAALTHPYITTDFSEALLELITPALTRAEEALAFLTDLHAHVHHHLDDELLWATSMPCVLKGGRQIPLARYGCSNAGRMKTVYRRGLGNRYGRTMQVIAGIHYNFSFGEGFWVRLQAIEGDRGAARAFRDRMQMGMLRNLQRIGWLVPYLFGASPAICASFVQGQETDLEHFDDTTLYYPYATSLRMGDIGYQNQQEEGTGIKASYDSLADYVRTLTWAIETPCPEYQRLGVKVGERYEQLNANVLQIENEYYSTVRPKQLTEWMERPTLALARRGIRYVELRSPDIDVFEPTGTSLEQLHFLELMMLHCLLADSPLVDAAERRAIDTNLVRTAHRGREPGLTLVRAGREIALRDWAEELLDRFAVLAELLDGGSDGPRAASLRIQRDKVADATATPSARVLAEMRAHGEGFFAFAQRMSSAHRAYFQGRRPSASHQVLFERLARDSHQQQQALERSETEGFDDFLARYFAQGEGEAGAA
ncbi:glutamate--cysteine ligase [Marichromatium bheemlicum]|uniref:Glutamate--cysteine ligase n=1 Tax=Marichromatium bheemlicum TaxID=365339 RepID=A0ABX1I8R2_9GAMM|nr:glutamate--cysteine ligase [Marichromatium bheemlicum]NKN33950.1 glutamate--cysteine ligase [Marichromatium bheemlicum]